MWGTPRCGVPPVWGTPPVRGTPPVCPPDPPEEAPLPERRLAACGCIDFGRQNKSWEGCGWTGLCRGLVGWRGVWLGSMASWACGLSRACGWAVVRRERVSCRGVWLDRIASWARELSRRVACKDCVISSDGSRAVCKHSVANCEQSAANCERLESGPPPYSPERAETVGNGRTW